MSKLKDWITLGSVAAALALSASANADTIDLFTDPAGGVEIETDGPTASITSGPFGSILGGYRDLIVSNVPAQGDQDGTCGPGQDCTNLSVFEGILSFSNDDNVDGIGRVEWDGGNGATFNPIGLQDAGGAGENFVNQEGCPVSGCSEFIFDVLSADLTFDFIIGIYTDATNFIEYNLAANTGPETSIIPFSFFESNALCGLTPPGSVTPLGLVNSVTCGGTNAPGTGSVADLTNVGGMYVSFNNDASGNAGTLSLDLSIGAVRKQAVPEPGVLALFGLGLAAGALARRKRAKA